MYTIKNNEDLKKYIPNYFSEVEGEPTIYDKVLPWLEISESWFIANVVGDFIQVVEQDYSEDILYRNLCVGVAAYAIHLAIPSLDLVCTPNGFGIVSTQTVLPASRERVERLSQSMLALRDNAIDMVLISLTSLPQWGMTEIGTDYMSSLFQKPSDVSFSCRFDEFREFLTHARTVEDKIIRLGISKAVFERLAQTPKAELTPTERHLKASVMDLVRSAVSWQKSNGDICPWFGRRLSDIVQIIRANPDEFPQWFQSKTRDLYEEAPFENDKNSGGYWL